MKNVSTKKLALALTALTLVGILVFCVACTPDPYKGDYQPVAEADREALVTSTTAKLEEINEHGLKNVKLTFKMQASSEEGDAKSTQEIKVTMVVDNQKIRADIDYNETKPDKTTKFTSTIWADFDTDEAWYKITIDGKTSQGKYDDSHNATEEVQLSIVIAALLGPNMITNVLGQFAEALTDTECELYADGENIKICVESTKDKETSKGEGYFLFFENGAFRCKFENTSEHDYVEDDVTYKGTDYNFAEIVTVTETVTMPTFE